MIKLWENLKSAILSFSLIIPNDVIGDPSAVFSCFEVTCIAVFKLLSMVCYIEYLTREMTAHESIRALHCFPTCTVMARQSMMNAIVTCVF